MANQYDVLGKAPGLEDLNKLSPNDVHLTIRGLNAGYGKMEILHNFDLTVSKAQSLCLIGPNGAGKSTILHSIYGFTNIFDGKIELEGNEITTLTPAQKLSKVGIAYILQDNSVFPDMTVEENLLMGGYIKDKQDEAYEEAERIFQKYERLRNRRNQPAKVLSGGERRLLEISRALVMKPSVLLVDEPSIGLEPKYINMVFEILEDLQKAEKKTIILVEQNAKKGLKNSDHVIIYDNSDVYSSCRVWYTFIYFGHDTNLVSVLDGDFKKWLKEKRPTSKEETKISRTNYKAKEDRSIVINKTQVEDNIIRNKFQLIDARSKQRFLGLQPEPRQGLRSGHVQGSKNLHFQLLLNEDRTFKKRNELINIFDKNEIDNDKDIAFTCGSGVTACILGLANSIISGKKPTIYDGSWSEYGLEKK